MSISNQVVFCTLPLGKPDPNQNKPLCGPDTRSRVAQKVSEGFTGWCNAFNMLRERYKAPNTSGLAGREFEKIASRLRKQIATENQTLPNVISCLNEVAENLKQVTKAPTEQQCQYLLELDNSIESGISLQSILPAFKTQEECNNLYEYIVSLKYEKRFEALGELFKQSNIDPAACREWLSQYSIAVRNHLLNYKMRELIAKAYHLEVSSWKPSHPIEALIEGLEKYGPLIVHGGFGKSFHKDAATALKEEIDGRQVFSWGKKEIEFVAIAYMVILVGAQKSSAGEFVYYIDPADESDPNDPTKQTVYKMHYGELIGENSILTLDGSKSTAEIVEAAGYALYFDRAAAQKQLEKEREPMIILK